MISAAGLLVVLVALWDIFHTLWHPGGFGRIARWVFQLVWWATKHVLPSHTRQLAGPIGTAARSGDRLGHAACVHGHGKVPTGGQVRSPLVAK